MNLPEFSIFDDAQIQVWKSKVIFFRFKPFYIVKTICKVHIHGNTNSDCWIGKHIFNIARSAKSHFTIIQSFVAHLDIDKKYNDKNGSNQKFERFQEEYSKSRALCTCCKRNKFIEKTLFFLTVYFNLIFSCFDKKI